MDTEKLEKLVSGFTKLTNENQQYIIGIAEALSFAQPKSTDKEKEPPEIKRGSEIKSWG